MTKQCDTTNAELARLLDDLDGRGHTALVEQVVTNDGRVYRASEGWTNELHRTPRGCSVIISGHRAVFLFSGVELAYAGDEQPTEWEISAVHLKCLRAERARGTVTP